VIAGQQAAHPAGRFADLGPHCPDEVCVVGEPEIGGQPGEVAVAVGQAAECGPYPQALPEPRECLAGLRAKHPAQVRLGNPEHVRKPAQPRERRIGYQHIPRRSGEPPVGR
jgi:hypothetical protein